MNKMDLHKIANAANYNETLAKHMSRKRWIKQDDKRFKNKADRKQTKQNLGKQHED